MEGEAGSEVAGEGRVGADVDTSQAASLQSKGSDACQQPNRTVVVEAAGCILPGRDRRIFVV